MAEFSFQFDIDFPADVRGTVEPLLNKSAWLFPLWMQKAIITFDSKSDEDEAMVKMILQKDYRWCRMVFFADFLCMPADVQEETIYHEIVHCYNVPLKSLACDIIDECAADNEKLQNVLRRQIDSVMEQITQDLAFVIMNKFKENAG